jgi:chemotaxis protein CheX
MATLSCNTPVAYQAPGITWGRLLANATQEVFEQMLGATVAPAVSEELAPVMDFTGLVGLSGALCGSLSVRCSAEAASLMTARMLGMEVEPFDEFVVDTIGEICNMVAGNFKSKIAGLADACLLSVPTVFRGAEYQLRSLTSGELVEACFLYEDMPFWVTLDLRTDNL